MIDALSVFDSDHDGKLSVDEFVHAMVNLGEKMTNEEVREIVGDSEVENNFIKIEDFARMIMNRS